MTKLSKLIGMLAGSPENTHGVTQKINQIFDTVICTTEKGFSYTLIKSQLHYGHNSCIGVTYTRKKSMFLRSRFQDLRRYTRAHIGIYTKKVKSKYITQNL